MGLGRRIRQLNMPGAEGKTVAVRVYTTGERVDLYLNGRKIGSKTLGTSDLQRVEFAVPYVSGELEAVALLDGRQFRKKLLTVGAPAALRLRPERKKHGAGRGDISFIGVQIVDAAETADFLLTAHSDVAAARRFIERAIDLHDMPKTVTIDKSGATPLPCKAWSPTAVCPSSCDSRNSQTT